MTGFEILDLVIGMIFIYFLLSLICVSLQETYARLWKLRMSNLKKWLTDTFNRDSSGETGLGSRIWCNIIVDGLTQSKRGASYLSRNTFVQALLHEIHYGTTGSPGKSQPYNENILPYDFDSLKNSIIESELLSSSIKRMLLQLHHDSFSNLETFKLKIGTWFDEAMERNSGTYKKRAQNSVLIFSFIVTIALNVDSIKLANYFYDNKDEAARVADAAEAMIKDKAVIERVQALKNHVSDTLAPGDTTLLAAIQSDVESIRKQQQQLAALRLPIGWNCSDEEAQQNSSSNTKNAEAKDSDDQPWYVTLIGWLITAIAVSLGAPFWFDTLNKLVNLRSSGRKPEEIKPNEAPTATSSTEKAFA